MTLQLQHLLPPSEGGEPTILTLDLGRLLLLSSSPSSPASSILSVEARSITGAFAAAADGDGGGSGCGAWEWGKGKEEAYVRVRMPPGGFCTLEVVVGEEVEMGDLGGTAAAAAMPLASPFAH